MDQVNLLKNWHEFSEKSKPRIKKDWDQKGNTFESTNALMKVQN